MISDRSALSEVVVIMFSDMITRVQMRHQSSFADAGGLMCVCDLYLAIQEVSNVAKHVNGCRDTCTGVLVSVKFVFVRLIQPHAPNLGKKSSSG